MNVRALLGATLGAIAGAVMWGAITYTTGYEVGFVAWGIGLLVGWGAVRIGAPGRTTGFACAALALCSIFAGKMFAVEWSVPGAVRDVAAETFTREAYEEARVDAADFAVLDGPEAYAAFMVTHGYTDVDALEAITPADVEAFEASAVPALVAMHNDQPDYATWRDGMIDWTTEAALEAMPIMDLVVADLGVFDVIFALLGLMTAFRIGSGGKA